MAQVVQPDLGARGLAGGEGQGEGQGEASEQSACRRPPSCPSASQATPGYAGPSRAQPRPPPDGRNAATRYLQASALEPAQARRLICSACPAPPRDSKIRRAYLGEWSLRLAAGQLGPGPAWAPSRATPALPCTPLPSLFLVIHGHTRQWGYQITSPEPLISRKLRKYEWPGDLACLRRCPQGSQGSPCG